MTMTSAGTAGRAMSVDAVIGRSARGAQNAESSIEISDSSVPRADSSHSRESC